MIIIQTFTATQHPDFVSEMPFDARSPSVVAEAAAERKLVASSESGAVAFDNDLEQAAAFAAGALQTGGRFGAP